MYIVEGGNVTSTEAYKISSNLKELAFTTESVINTIKSAKVSVNENQLGDIPDTISAALDNQIVTLNICWWIKKKRTRKIETKKWANKARNRTKKY